MLVVVTTEMSYVKARKEADKLAAKYGLIVADMPMAIQAMTNHPKVRQVIRPRWIDTITGEYHGLRDDGRSYEAWHSVGSLATAKDLEKAFSNACNCAFMKIADDEWISVGKGNYEGQHVARIHLDDMKKGRVPAPGIPYTVFVRLDKDAPKINRRGQLNYDRFMRDDRVLMITGSPESREALAKMFFGSKEDGGEGLNSVGGYHRINEVGFEAIAKGRLVYLCGSNGGLGGVGDIHSYGRFVVVGQGDVLHETNENRGFSEPRNSSVFQESAPQIVATLEQTLAIINDPDLNREGMIKAISQLYSC